MRFYHMNEEITYARNPLVEENVFLKMEAEKTPLPTFADNRDQLPNPIWDSHDDYINCYWRVWELAFGNLGQPKEGTGFVSNFIDTAFNGCIFMWDSSFILMFGKYADRLFKFQNTLDHFYSHQHKDGFISRQIDESTGGEYFTRLDPTSTGPNILVWCEWEYFLNFGNKERLARVFPPLMAFHRWMKAHLTWPDGTYYSTGWGCGMDNLPRMEPGVNICFEHGHMIWVDTCMQELNNCNILINMCKILGREEFIEELENEKVMLEKVIRLREKNDKACRKNTDDGTNNGNDIGNADNGRKQKGILNSVEPDCNVDQNGNDKGIKEFASKKSAKGAVGRIDNVGDLFVRLIAEKRFA